MFKFTRCCHRSIRTGNPSPGAGRSRLRALASISLAAAITGVAAGQAAPTWNRSIVAVAVDADGTGPAVIQPYFRVDVPTALTFMDLSTVVEISVNGTAIDSQTFDITVSPASTPGCGLGCSSVYQVCTCFDPDGPGSAPPICYCGVPIDKCDPVLASIKPGDEITVILYPAPGALPEPDDDGDAHVADFTGQSINWDRAIDAVTVVPNPSGPGFFDIFVDVSMYTQYEGGLDLDIGVELTSAFGVQASLAPDDLPLSSGLCLGLIECGTSCAWDTAGSALGYCNILAGTNCNCTWTSAGLYVLEGVQLLPGHEYDLHLSPGTGVLTPYLPDSSDDAGSDSITLIGPCDGDLDYNGIVNGVDLAMLLAVWGSGDDAADLDHNGIVNGFDLALLLAAWGQCDLYVPPV